jgi:predicted kinase
MAPLRCHLLIGPPASGKTTLARTLAPLLRGPGESSALVLSTDAIREEVFGDAAVQGPWREIEARLHQRLLAAVAAGIPVIVDATHAKRPWRLALTQALALPAPVEWIGWWLFTPLPTCLRWNESRSRPVPVPVIEEMAAALADPHFGPSRAEGFAALCAVVPEHHDDLEPVLQAELAGLDRRIRSARNRERRFQLHGHSRLLDLERLLYLIRLLASFPDLDGSDPATAAELEAIVSPLPQGDLADRAATFLRALHGDCYADAEAIRADLAWLEANGFTGAVPVDRPIRLAPVPQALIRSGQRVPPAGGVHGGYPPSGDGPVFVRVMTLLHHRLQGPFDRAAEKGCHLPGETATLGKNIEKLLTSYGFRPRNDTVRHDHCLGTVGTTAARPADPTMETRAHHTHPSRR